jgi:hypothetical protein
MIVSVIGQVGPDKTRLLPLAEAPDSASVLAQLERILSNSLFQHSKRYPAFLRHVVEQTLRGGTDQLKERILGIEVFRRSPDYDTSRDPVVRNTASEVRKRLEEYYSEAGREAELRISLPPGGYHPEFRRPAGNGCRVSEELQIAPPEAGGHRWRKLAVGLALLVVIGLLSGMAFFPRKSAVKLFWAPILQTSDPVLVVKDTSVALREQQTDSGGNSSLVRETIDPKTFLHVSEQSAKLASFLVAQGKHLDFELARNVSAATLRTRPFILEGAFNNRWTLRAVAPFRFYFQLDRNPLIRRILDRQNPARRNWAAPMSSPLTEDYALIARAPEPQTGQMMLVIAGLGGKGSAAALEFVTNPKYLDRFAAQAPAGWERRNIELVIQCSIANDDWGEPRVVATHFW